VPYFNWGPAYVRYVKAVREGKFKQGWEWEGPDWKNINDHDKSAVGFKFGPALSDAEKKNLEAFIQDLASGKVKVFSGPLNFQDGSAYLKAGEQATDKQIWYFPQLLKGMEGASK